MAGDAIGSQTKDCLSSLYLVEYPIIVVVDQVAVQEFFGEGQGPFISALYAAEGLEAGSVIEGIVL